MASSRTVPKAVLRWIRVYAKVRKSKKKRNPFQQEYDTSGFEVGTLRGGSSNSRRLSHMWCCVMHPQPVPEKEHPIDDTT